MLGFRILRNFSTTASKKLTDVFVVLGGPGSGKGTQCDLLAKKYDMKHVSAGELLREEMKKDTPEKEIIDKCIREGQIVPSEITVRLLLNNIQQQPEKKYLIDGFPRNQENLGSWERISKNHTHTRACLFFDCGLEKMTERILGRSKTSGRTDDNMESLKKRFAIFENETRPVLNYFATKGKLITINAENSVEEVFAETEHKAKDLILDQTHQDNPVMDVI